MDMMELGAIGELVGGVAVVVTLGYLAVQIRQNTKSTRYLATQNLVAGQAEANFLFATHEDLAAIIQAGVVDNALEGMTPQDQFRFSSFMLGIYTQVDYAYHQYLDGQLDERYWRRWEQEIPLFLGSSGLAAWWARDKSRFSAEFVEYVDRRVAEFTPPPTLPTMGRPS